MNILWKNAYLNILKYTQNNVFITIHAFLIRTEHFHIAH